MSDDKMNVNNIEAEYNDIANRNAWPIVYQRIGRECQSFSYTYIEAKKPQNKQFNRYRDVNPYDHSRIVLKRAQFDYINANLVKMPRADRKYILTQGPLVYTVSHFWLMVWEQKSRAILMLNKVIEKNEMKCHWYWPLGMGEDHKLVLKDVNLTVEQISEEDCNYYSTRIFRIFDIDTCTSREVLQFHYTTWPDFGVPSSPVAFLEFLRKVRESGALDPDAGPAVVHCSAGIGRSGTFCLVDSCLVIIEKEGIQNVNVQQVLIEMRKDRMGLIQTPDQLRFSYQAIIEGARQLRPQLEGEAALADNANAMLALEEAWIAEINAAGGCVRPRAHTPPLGAAAVAGPSGLNVDEAPPPPPPRGESLAVPPKRPLPAIPNSSSLGDLQIDPLEESASSSDEEESQIVAAPSTSTSSMSGDDEPLIIPPVESIEGSETLRKRRTRDLQERVAAMKRRANEVEKWASLKRCKSEGIPQPEPREN